jgi:hypothetical protein
VREKRTLCQLNLLSEFTLSSLKARGLLPGSCPWRLPFTYASFLKEGYKKFVFDISGIRRVMSSLTPQNMIMGCGTGLFIPSIINRFDSFLQADVVCKECGNCLEDVNHSACLQDIAQRNPQVPRPSCNFPYTGLSSILFKLAL